MTPTPDPSDARRTVELQNLLAVYLATSPSFCCPGCDGMLIEDALTACPAAATGFLTDEADLYSRHSELTPQIVAFFFLLAVDANPVGGSEVDLTGRREEYETLSPCLK